MTNQKCPCENCPCIPMCRLKNFWTLASSCELLTIYEPDLRFISKRDQNKLIAIANNLNPVPWKLSITPESDTAYAITPNDNQHLSWQEKNVYE